MSDYYDAELADENNFLYAGDPAYDHDEPEEDQEDVEA